MVYVMFLIAVMPYVMFQLSGAQMDLQTPSCRQLIAPKGTQYNSRRCQCHTHVAPGYEGQAARDTTTELLS